LQNSASPQLSFFQTDSLDTFEDFQCISLVNRQCKYTNLLKELVHETLFNNNDHLIRLFRVLSLRNRKQGVSEVVQENDEKSVEEKSFALLKQLVLVIKVIMAFSFTDRGRGNWSWD